VEGTVVDDIGKGTVLQEGKQKLTKRGGENHDEKAAARETIRNAIICDAPGGMLVLPRLEKLPFLRGPLLCWGLRIRSAEKVRRFREK